MKKTARKTVRKKATKTAATATRKKVAKVTTNVVPNRFTVTRNQLASVASFYNKQNKALPKWLANKLA